MAAQPGGLTERNAQAARMVLLSHDSEEDARAAARVLRGLGGHARRLMAQCVEEQQLTRKSVSAAARALEDAGFLFVRDEGDLYEEAYALTPSLAGEEALETLELMEKADD
jgi:hypothetical protein